MMFITAIACGILAIGGFCSLVGYGIFAKHYLDEARHLISPPAVHTTAAATPSPSTPDAVIPPTDPNGERESAGLAQ